jgi:hypothetical protein
MSEEKPKNTKMPTDSPRLQARLKYYDVRPPKWTPLFDRVFVLPIGGKDQDDGMTIAGTDKKIHFANQTKDVMAAQRGLVVAAGHKGWEELYAMGIGLGDVVICSRLSRYEKAYTVEGRPYSVLIVQAGEITAGEDLYDAFDKGDIWYEMDPETGKVYVADREGVFDRNDPQSQPDGV